MAAVRLFAEVFGGAAEWAERLQQPDLMATFLRRGLEAASAMDGPDSALCWAAMPHWQHWAGDPDLAPLLTWLGDVDSDAMFERASAQIDTDFDWWARGVSRGVDEQLPKLGFRARARIRRGDPSAHDRRSCTRDLVDPRIADDSRGSRPVCARRTSPAVRAPRG